MGGEAGMAEAETQAAMEQVSVGVVMESSTPDPRVPRHCITPSLSGHPGLISALVPVCRDGHGVGFAARLDGQLDVVARAFFFEVRNELHGRVVVLVGPDIAVHLIPRLNRG